MKIVMASHYFASHKGGIEVVADELFRGFSARGQEVVWLAGDATHPPDDIGQSRAIALRVFNFVERKIGLPFPIPWPSALVQINREVRDADVVVLQDCLYLTNILAFLAARLRRVPAVIVQHTRFTPYKSALVNLVMRISNTIVTRPMLSRASQVVFISETTRRFFQKKNFKAEPKVIWNGVHTGLYYPAEDRETKANIRYKFDLPHDRLVVLFVGRFVEKKGISIMEHMVRLRPDWTWAFAGWGPVDPRSWNTGNVKVFSDLWGTTMAALYRACDLLVLPSTGEGFPLVVQEALSSGLPVVCGADTLDADPAMQSFVEGVVVRTHEEERTAEEFVSRIAAVFKSGANESGMRDERRAFAVSRYSWQTALDCYLEILRCLGSNQPDVSEIREVRS